MLLRNAFLVALAIMAGGPVRAGLFDDDEARKRIIASEKEMREKNAALDERISKLEASIRNLGILELVNQIEAVKGELSQLRGQIEVVGNQIATVDKKQRDFYLDLDSRLRRLEQPSAGAAAPSTVTPANPVSASSTSMPPLDPKEAAKRAIAEKKAYDGAYALFQKQNYAAALSGFQSFIDTYPASQSLASAHYWAGLSQYNLQHLKAALTTQQNLLKSFPDSPKVPDAMLAIAAIHSDLGDGAAARNLLEDIIARYPASEAAGKAKQRLATVKK